MKDKSNINRHQNLMKFVKSAFIAYTVFAILLVATKLTIHKEISTVHIIIYVSLYLLATLIFYFFINRKYYLKLKADKNFFIIPSIVGLLLGQYYFYLLGPARWVYALVLSISYLGITYQNYKTVLFFSITSASANLILIIIVHIFKIQQAILAQDIIVVAVHYVIAAFMIPITRFFNYISDSYKDILHVLRDRNHIIEKDLELAYTIQKSLLPSEYPLFENVKFASKYIPMDIVGGDFYDFIKISDKELGIFISDVSGHGVPAALITSMIKVAVSSVNKTTLKKPSKFFKIINETLFDKTATNFITAFYGIINTEYKTFKYSNAGHCAPIYYNVKENVTNKLETDGIVLGAFEGVEFEEKKIQISPGDKLLLYTDGLVETMDFNRNQYGIRGLQSFTDKFSKKPIGQFVHELYNDVCEWMPETANFEDDIVIIGIDFI